MTGLHSAVEKQALAAPTGWEYSLQGYWLYGFLKFQFNCKNFFIFFLKKKINSSYMFLLESFFLVPCQKQ